jgi:zinc protease
MTKPAAETLHRYLPNGMEVYLERTTLAPLSCLQLWIKTGSLDEEEHEAGLAHFVEHMLFKGTAKFPGSGEIAETVEHAGGELNAFTKFENTVYQATVPAHFTKETTEILLSMVSEATFDATEIDKERPVILEEATRLRDHPGSVASLHLFSEIFRGTRLERPIIGHIDVIKNAPHKLLNHFYKKWYVPNNMIFVAAGDFDVQELFAYLQKTTADFKPGSLPQRARNILPLTPQTVQPIRIFRGPWQESRVIMGCPSPVLESSETPVWHMFASLLGSGDSCRLTRAVHDERQLVATIDTGLFMPRTLKGMFTMSYFGETAKSADAACAAVEEIVRLAKEGPTTAEMNRIVNNMFADRVFGRESVEGLVNNAGFALQTTRKLDFEDHYTKTLQTVSAADIRNVAKKVSDAILQSHAMFSIAADEHAPSDFSEDAFLEAARYPLQKIQSIAGWRENPEFLQHRHHVSERNSAVQQLQFDLPGSRTLHVNFREVKRLPLVSASLVFPGGTILEDAEKMGAAHIATELLTHGTTRQSYEAFVDELEDKAGSISTFSTHDMCGIQMDCLSTHAPRIFEMLTDCVFRPALSPIQWERVRTDSLNAIIAQKDNPMVIIRRHLSPILFGNHSYGRHPLGTENSLNALTLDDIQVQFQRMLASKKYVLSLAGDFDINHVVERIHAECTNLSHCLDASLAEEWESRMASETPRSPQASDTRFAFVPLRREQAHLAIAFRTFPITDARRLAIELGSTVLGGQGGRLFRDLRDTRSLAYSLGTSHIIQARAGSFYAFMSTASQKTEEAFNGLTSHIEELAAECVSEKELERAKKSLLGGRNIDAQYFHYQASQLSVSDVYGLGFDNFLKFDDRVNAITAQDVRDAFATVLSTNHLVGCVVGPEGTWCPDGCEPA